MRKWKAPGTSDRLTPLRTVARAIAEARLLEFDHRVLSVACRASYTDARAPGATARAAWNGRRRAARTGATRFGRAPRRPPTEVAMRLTCPNCGAEYDVSDGMVPAAGRHVQCTACHTRWFVRGVPGAGLTEDQILRRLETWSPGPRPVPAVPRCPSPVDARPHRGARRGRVPPRPPEPEAEPNPVAADPPVVVHLPPRRAAPAKPADRPAVAQPAPLSDRCPAATGPPARSRRAGRAAGRGSAARAEPLRPRPPPRPRPRRSRARRLPLPRPHRRPGAAGPPGAHRLRRDHRPLARPRSRSASPRSAPAKHPTPEAEPVPRRPIYGNLPVARARHAYARCISCA